MKKLIREYIDYKKCNAYSGIAHMYAAIGVTGRPVFAVGNNDTTDNAVPDDVKGGIVVFPAGTDAVMSDIKKIAQKHDPAGWTIGRFFKGRYSTGNGKAYSEDSISIEITGVSEDTLLETAEEFCRAFGQESALIKSYSERNRVYVAEVE